jgi:phage shock protein PspC (stress-responsive transcriptional regulator)
MKKTHSANIGGTVFQIEEDAFEHLQAYLQSIEAHFLSYPDIADILFDIEGRIAEQLLQRQPGPQVVRMADVERVIETMGRIEQFADPVTEQAAPVERRKLFRDPDQQLIAGVAAGLASYLGLPTLLVRLLFVLLLFFFGTALVVYLLLWALVPAASTTTDKLQMRGRPLTLASIDRGIRDSVGSIPATTRSAATQGIVAAGSLVRVAVVSAARAVRWTAGVLVVGAAALGVLALTVLLVVTLVNAGAAPLDPSVSAFFAAFGSWQHAFKVFIYLLAVIPLAVIIATGLRLFWSVNRVNSRGLAGMLGLWVISLLATAAIWSSSYPELGRVWDEYPAMERAHRQVDRLRTLLATTAPLTEQQSQALMAMLVPEYKRLQDESVFGFRGASGPLSWLESEEHKLRARQESDRRIIESARSYLDAEQLAVVENSLERYTTMAQASLDARRRRHAGCRLDCESLTEGL